jgi:rifampin ADP-ribosylating transferase
MSDRIAKLRTGVALPYSEQGRPDGTPVVLLHAWGESRHAFSRVFPFLPDTLRVLAPDQRGHRDATKPRTGYAFTDYVADVEAFLDAVGADSAVIAGSSSGGYVGQQFALDHPGRTRGLVLIGAPLSLHGRAPFADELESLTDPIERDWVRGSLSWFRFQRPVPQEYLEDRVEDGVRMPARVWRDALAGLSEAQPPTEAGVIGVPTLVICGARDELLPADTGERLTAAIPGALLRTYEDGGHLVLWEQPERVARDITEFAASLAPD